MLIEPLAKVSRESLLLSYSSRIGVRDKLQAGLPAVGRYPDAVPAKAGNYKELGSCFHRKPWIPDKDLGNDE
ncbi:MAG: hypothetical protein V3R54_04510 [Thermodesulfovibrionia bacterium]